jgi:uncharacterized CHY-type Zn-finger protein
MKRAPEIQKLINELAKRMFGRTMTEAFEGKICVCCGEKVTAFRDRLSAKEYGISGLCPVCQDVTFCDPEGDDNENE